jgi:pSer/pThr/pTyr-binding forkhead associated (FHA) protein
MPATTILVLRILLIASLYGFLLWAFFTIWRDLKRQSMILADHQAPPIILSGQDGQSVYRFTKPEIVIGRDPVYDISLNDKTVSTQHARLSHHHHQWWVEDLNSTNGTFLNQEPVSTSVVVTSGDQLRCGQVVFGIRISRDEEDINGS